MSLARLLERLETTDVGALDVGGVSAGMRDVARLRGYLTVVEAGLARRADELAASGSGIPADELLGRSQSMSRRESQRAARRAETLGELPAMTGQLGAGRIGTEHADALTSAASRLDDGDRSALFALDAELATHATSSTPEQFRRHVDRVVDQLAADRGLERAERQRRAATLAKGINHDTGMYWLRAELDPESGVRVFTALDAELAALVTADRSSDATDGGAGDAESAPGRRRDQLAAQALVGLVTSAHRSRRPGRTEMLMLVDHETIVNDLHDRSICEYVDGSQLPVATARRLACNADIYPVVLGADGVVLDMGRSRRLATPDQRRALRSMYRSCGVGDCEVPFDRCEIHHLDDWSSLLGLTNLDRLIPACSRHHDLAHEGGWQLELDPATRELTVRLADGTLHSRGRPGLSPASRSGPAPPGRRQPTRAGTATTVGEVA
jgi:hypothetical protein